MEPTLLIDGNMRRGARNRLEPGDFAERNIIRVTRNAGLELKRFPLVESPQLDRVAAKKLVKNRKGIVIGGSCLLHPTEDKRVLGFNYSDKAISTGEINETLLNIIWGCYSQGVPLLGICYGHQMVARFAGEKLIEIPKPEFGFYDVMLTESGTQDAIFAGVSKKAKFAEYHSLGIAEAENAEVLALNSSCIQAIKLPGHGIYGMQFHPDFHWNADNRGTGGLKCLFQEENPGKESRIEPEDPFRAYSLNNIPLLNFMKMCENRE
ncbi:hypothetical protein GF415_03950 [Candidatus Micrarchaeota archaeon]|nr:hypothetical protein [Candidatus Micrarchaeota archaeon]